METHAQAYRLTYRTGATGYIGGDALYALMRKHPNDYQVSALVRNSDKGAQVASQYPRIRLVYGGLDNAELLEGEAREADIVLRMSFAGPTTPICKPSPGTADS